MKIIDIFVSIMYIDIAYHTMKKQNTLSVQQKKHLNFIGIGKIDRKFKII